MTIVEYEAPTPLPPSAPGDELEQGPTGWVARLRGAAEYARYIADTDFVPLALRGNPAAIAAAILYGQEVGFEPMQSLAKIAVIKGRPTLYAEAQRGLVTSRGHELWFDESTTTRAIAAGRRAGSDRIGRITFTMDDAKRAGLAGGEAWRRYPAEMLRARASAALCRAMFADVIGGMPATEELEDEPDNGTPAAPPPTPPPGDAPSAPAAGRTRRRRTAPTPDKPAAAGPVEAPPPPDPQPAPDPPPEPGPEPQATDAQKRQIFALMRDVGMPPSDRDARLAYTVRIVGRQLESSNDLTIADAARVIDDLQEIVKLPADERPARLVSANEAAVLAELDQLAAEEAVEHARDAPSAPTTHENHPDDDIPF